MRLRNFLTVGNSKLHTVKAIGVSVDRFHIVLVRGAMFGSCIKYNRGADAAAK